MKLIDSIRTCIRIATASTVTVLALSGNALAQDFSKVEIMAERLNETTWMLVGAGDNMALSVGEDAVFLVDDQYAPMVPKIKAAIAAITKKPVQFVLNTHFHFDHTDGDLIVHFKGGDIVHMGDVFFNGTYPFIDIGSGGSPLGMIAAFDRVLTLAGEKTKIVPGLGPLADKAAVQRTRDMLATLTQRIADQRRAGKSDEQVRAAKPTADHDAVWGQGFIKPDQFVQQVLNGLPK